MTAYAKKLPCVCTVCAGLCICMQQMINTTSFHLSKMNGGRASSAFHQCVRRIHIHTHKHTSMSTCLSVRFYHHRDTVDSPFVRAEKIGALRFQAHTFAMTYKGFACIRMCVSMFQQHTEEKGQGCELQVNGKINENLHICFSQHLFLRFDFPGFVRAALQIEVRGVEFQKKRKGSNINTSLCIITNTKR